MPEISDLFIQSTSGLPYMANCYGGEYCKMHSDHALITGFFAAMNSFKGEFQQESLNLIKFDDLTLVLEQFGEFMVIISLDEFKHHERITVLAKEVLKEFTDRYGAQLEKNNYARIPDLSEFEKWLHDKVGDAVGDLTPLLSGRKKSFLNKIKNIFN